MPGTHANPNPHDVYTAYNAEGRVLYVGQSVNALQRIAQHRYTSPWGRAWARLELRSFPTRADALSFEAALIRALRPAHNCDQPQSPLARALTTLDQIAAALNSYARFASPVSGLSPDQFRDLVEHSQMLARMKPHFSKHRV